MFQEIWTIKATKNDNNCELVLLAQSNWNTAYDNVALFLMNASFLFVCKHIIHAWESDDKSITVEEASVEFLFQANALEMRLFHVVLLCSNTLVVIDLFVSWIMDAM